MLRRKRQPEPAAFSVWSLKRESDWRVSAVLDDRSGGARIFSGS